MKPTSKSKTFVFIDGSNIFFSQIYLGWDFNWQKIIRKLKKDFNVKKIIYYTGIKENDPNSQKFLEKLTKLKITVFTKPLKRIVGDKKGIFFKSNCDVEIAVDMILNQNQYDTAVLFSGDSDFVYAVKKLQRLYSKKIHIYSTRKFISWEIKMSADKYNFLEDIKSEIEYKKTSARKRSDYYNNKYTKKIIKVK